MKSFNGWTFTPETRRVIRVLVVLLVVALVIWAFAGCKSWPFAKEKPPVIVGPPAPPQTQAQEKFELMLVGVAGLAVLGLGGSIVAGLMGLGKVGIVGAATSLAIGAVCTLMIYYGDAFAFVLFIVAALALIALAAWAFLKRKRIWNEVITTCEIAKNNLPEPDRQRLFGDDGCVADAIQKSDTQRIVKGVRTKINPVYLKGASDGTNDT